MDKKLRRFFTGSIISALVVCLVVFIFLTLFMSSQTEKSVANISHTYMEENVFSRVLQNMDRR